MSGEGEIRKAIVEADLVDCMIALPGQLFYTTQIPACLWFLARDKSGGNGKAPKRDRRGEVLFINARKLGEMRDRTHRELAEAQIDLIAETYHAWRENDGEYEDIPVFANRPHWKNYRNTIMCSHPVVTWAWKIWMITVSLFEEKFNRFIQTLQSQFANSDKLQQSIQDNLSRLNHE